MLRVNGEFNWQALIGWVMILICAGACFLFAFVGWFISPWHWLTFAFGAVGIAGILVYRWAYLDNKREQEEYYGPGKWPGGY
jgi:hypothetical protein